MDLMAYLKRIGYTGSLTPTASALRSIQRAHMFTVPFENLDVHTSKYIELDIPSFYEKIVGRKRGGYCYELNGLFSWLLEKLGFDMRLLAGRVFRDGSLGREFGHMNILVSLEQRWLVDVGFGNSFIEPLLLDEEGEQHQFGRSYRIVRSDNE